MKNNLKILFNALSSSLLFNKNNFTFNEGLPITEKPKKSLKSTMLKIGFAAAALLMITTTGSSSLNKGLPLSNNNFNKEEKDEEIKGTKMYVYGAPNGANVPRGIISWTGNRGPESPGVFLAFSPLSEDFQNEYGLKSLGTLKVPMFYMRDDLEQGKPPVIYVSADPKDGHILGPVALEDAEIYTIIDNLTGKKFNVSYEVMIGIYNSHNLRYTIVGPCTKGVALKYGVSIKNSEPYRDFAQNTVVDAFTNTASISNSVSR